jgi:hypothetical protein
MKHALFALGALAAILPAQSSAISLSNSLDGYVEVPYSTHVVPQSGITVEAWITYDDATLGSGWRYPTVLRQNRNAGQESFFLRVNADNQNRTVLRWLVNANSILTVDWTFAPGQLTTWTHVAGTWDGQTARLFVNGQEVGTPRTGSGPLRDQGDVLRIGKGSDVATPIEVWNGSIDEVRLWPFARSAAEISATMNLELSSVPGQVSTWNFNQNANDSSSQRNGTIGGSVSFTSGGPTLTPNTFPGAAFGASTDGCLGAIESTTSSLPQIGNAGFAIVAHRIAAAAPTICVLAGSGAASPLNIVGIDLWVDPTTLIDGFGATVDALGTARFPLPIPASLPAGVSLAAQFVSIDVCGPAGLTASKAVVFVTLP